jgi:hypothetical protein
MASKSLKVNDRVRRVYGGGCCGTVKDVREEVTASADDRREKALLINVLWDNGTMSCFSPDGLEAAEG